MCPWGEGGLLLKVFITKNTLHCAGNMKLTGHQISQSGLHRHIALFY